MKPYIIEYKVNGEYKRVIIHAVSHEQADAQFREMSTCRVTRIEVAQGWDRPA